MTSESQEILLINFCNFAVLSVITYFDFIVHHTLYQYGLVFSYDWARPYWNALFLLEISISFYGMAIYWFKRSEDLRHLLTATLIGLSNYLMSFNLDVLWFCFAGGLPPLDEVWWWFWLDGFLGIRWTTRWQILLTVVVDLILFSIWIGWAIYLNKKDN